MLDGRPRNAISYLQRLRKITKALQSEGVGVSVSIQIAILKVLASHGNGRATLASLKRDIVILTASGGDWSARLKRLAGRVPSIDIFGSRYVLCDDEGWEITAEGRVFLCALESVTQDNRSAEIEHPEFPTSEVAERPPGTLIIVGDRFKNRLRPGQGAGGQVAFPGNGATREGSVSKKK